MDGLVAVAAAAAAMNNGGEKEKPQKKRKPNNTNTGQQNVSAARARRLEQNRKAAIESRRRKKIMVAELQRSVTFYTKANENLKKANEELEKSLVLAKQKLLSQKDDDDKSVAASGGLKTPEEERSVEGKSSLEAPKIEQQTVPITVDAPVSTAQQIASFQPPVNASLADQAHLTAMQAVYENMGYPTAAARSVASLFSQTGAGLNDMPPPPTDADAEGAGDEYIKSLETFAMERTAAANAATLAANTALRIANWHKMMKMNASPVMCTSSENKTTPPPESSSSVNKKD